MVLTGSSPGCLRHPITSAHLRAALSPSSRSGALWNDRLTASKDREGGELTANRSIPYPFDLWTVSNHRIRAFEEPENLPLLAQLSVRQHVRFRVIEPIVDHQNRADFSGGLQDGYVSSLLKAAVRARTPRADPITRGPCLRDDCVVRAVEGQDAIFQFAVINEDDGALPGGEVPNGREIAASDAALPLQPGACVVRLESVGFGKKGRQLSRWRK